MEDRMNRPLEFENSDEIVRHLRTHSRHFEQCFEERIEDLLEIIRSSVEQNTFRAFRHMPSKPSAVFRTWACSRLCNGQIRGQILAIRTQVDYDEWAQRLGTHLAQAWKQQMGSGNQMHYGPSRKLPNLLMKRFALWSQLTGDQRRNLICLLHVPFDSYTLRAIRKCIPDRHNKDIGPIPSNATMSFVTNRKQYDGLQRVAREFAAQASVPPIYLDLLWNEAHS
jgi:hypothetical protein